MAPPTGYVYLFNTCMKLYEDLYIRVVKLIYLSLQYLHETLLLKNNSAKIYIFQIFFKLCYFAIFFFFKCIIQHKWLLLWKVIN
jgi:hypothetical protein